MTLTLETVKTYRYIVTEEQLAQVDKDLTDYCKIFELRGRKPKLAADLETYSPKGKKVEDIRCIKGIDGEYEGRIRLLILALDPSVEDIQYIIDVMSIGEDIVAKYINKYWKKCLIIGMNFIYDLPFIIEFFKAYPETVRDIMLLSQQDNAGDKLAFIGGMFGRRSHSFVSILRSYLDWGWFKSKTGMDFDEFEAFKERHQGMDWSKPVLSEDDLKYAGWDGSLLHHAYVAQLKKLEEYMKKHNKPGMLNAFKLECEVLIEFAIMSLVGVPFDQQYYESEVDPYLRSKLKEAEDALSRHPEFWEEVDNETTQVPLMDGTKLKIGSRKIKVPYSKFINLGGKATKAGPGQLQRALARAGLKFDNCQQETFEVTLYDTGKAAKLSDKQKSILMNVLKWVKAKGSLLDKYGMDALAEHLYEDGRFYPKWWQIATDTHRTACTKPPLQTLPGGDDLFEDGEKIGKKIRKGIGSPAGSGKKIIVADWSNQEVRLAYMVTKDEYLKKVFLENRDQHSEFAQEAFQLDYLPKKGDDLRQAGKTAFLQHQYCGGWKSMREAIYIDTRCRLLLEDDKAKELKEKLKHRYAGITLTAEECKKEVIRALEPFQTLRSFENRKPIFTGFTRLKYTINGESKEITKKRSWHLYKEQEILIKRTKDKKAIKEWKTTKKRLSKLTLIRPYDTVRKVAICSVDFGKLRIDRRPQFRFQDTLHRNYQKYNEEREEWSTWNNDFNKRVSEICREYFNFLMQPEGATMLKIAMVAIGKDFRARGWDPKHDASIIAECHDSLIVECREDIAEEVKEVMQKHMVEAAASVIKGIPTPVSIGIGDNWGDAE